MLNSQTAFSEMTQKQPLYHSRSLKVTNFDINGKTICHFLLVPTEGSLLCDFLLVSYRVCYILLCTVS